MDSNASRLITMAILGFLMLMVAARGKLGSILAAVIDPKGLHKATTSTTGLPTSGTLTPKEIGQYASNAGFSGKPLITAIAIALAESGGVVAAKHTNTNGTTDYGLWQINSVHTEYDTSQLLNAAYNANAAYAISTQGTNFHPWTTYNNQAYQTHLAEATVAANQIGA